MIDQQPADRANKPGAAAHAIAVTMLIKVGTNRSREQNHAITSHPWSMLISLYLPATKFFCQPQLEWT